jgi:hypothetical protein
MITRYSFSAGLCALMLSTCVALAGEGAGNVDAPSPRGAGPESPSTVEAFSGVDITSHDNTAAWTGAIVALNKDLDTSGLRLWFLAEGGPYHYNSDSGADIHARYWTGDAFLGYGFEGNNYSIDVLAGLSGENDRLFQADPQNPVRGTEFGFGVRTDYWINPTAQTLVAGEAEYSTAFQTYLAKVKLGYDIGRQIFLGPEATILGNERYTQWRVGGHFTQITFGKIQANLSAGYLLDSDLGAGAYGQVELSTRF